ncbi:EAL domain-containing response regulator [Neisseriaceae bacterium TC5R-5]|nr:EAL domain-containing response regulator [Neisseriaceae bacterium TC5R-5]
MALMSGKQSCADPQRVLIVEDHDLQRFVLCETVKRMGVISVDEAANGLIALELLKHQEYEYDLMICDLSMPEMDGIELLKHLACLDHVPFIIFISALSQDILAGAHRVASHYDLPIIGNLDKPFSVAKLRELWSSTAGPLRRQVLQCHLPERQFSAQDLLKALYHGDIFPWYQPQIDPYRHCVVGVEALARWQHPVHGLLEPASFLSSIEYHRLDTNLFAAVYQAVIDDYRSWCLEDPALSLGVSINVSARHFCEPSLPEQLRSPLEASGLTPNHITLELTETQFLDNVNHALENVLRLRMQGFNVSLDDFGAGYAGLQYLRELPVNAIKIDRSLIEGAADDAGAETILMSTISLARSQNMQVLAEGVSQQADYDMLMRLHVDLMQGFLMGRPMPAAEVLQFAHRYNQQGRDDKLPSESL